MPHTGNLVISFLLLVLLSACATPQATPPESLSDWRARFPKGFVLQVECALAAENAYHTISDTPINQLLTEEGSSRIGELVTRSRDLFRQWQSYGAYRVPYRYYWPYAGATIDGLSYSRGSAGRPAEYGFLGGVKVQGWPAVQGSLTSSRGRPISDNVDYVYSIDVADSNDD